MAVNNNFFILAFAMSLEICVQGITISHDKQDYHFGKHQSGDATLLRNLKVQEERHLYHHHEYVTYILRHPSDKVVKRLNKEEAKDPEYVPAISEIIIKDQGGGSDDCKIINGGIGQQHVTLRFTNHLFGGKLDYKVTIKGQ